MEEVHRTRKANDSSDKCHPPKFNNCPTQSLREVCRLTSKH